MLAASVNQFQTSPQYRGAGVHWSEANSRDRFGISIPYCFCVPILLLEITGHVVIDPIRVDFDQNSCTRTYNFEQVKTSWLLESPYCRENSQGSELVPFWAKSLSYSPWFWTWRILVSAGNRSNSLKRLYACKLISNCLRDRLYGLRVNSQVSEIGRFWAKSLGYSPWFWTWRILVSAGSRSKLPETPPSCLQIDF